MSDIVTDCDNVINCHKCHSCHLNYYILFQVWEMTMIKINTKIGTSLTITMLCIIMFTLSSTTHAFATGEEIIEVKVNGNSFKQGDPISIISTGASISDKPTNLTQFKSEVAAIPNPCGVSYFNVVLIKGSFPSISTYEELLSLKTNYLNIEYPYPEMTFNCFGINTDSVISAEISPERQIVISADEIAKLSTKSRGGLFDNQNPSLIRSDTIVTYKQKTGEIKQLNRPLFYPIWNVTKYYDTEVTREIVEPPVGFEDATMVYRKSHLFEPGEYTIVASTLSGAISKPVIINIIPNNGIQTTFWDESLGTITMMLLGSGGVIGTVAGISSKVSTKISSIDKKTLQKTTYVISTIAIVLMGGLPLNTSEAATWDTGAQGIKAQSTTSAFNVASVEDEFFGVQYQGPGASKGQSTQNNAYLSGTLALGMTDYVWSQALVETYAKTDTTYSSYTCTTQSGTYTCQYPNKIVVKGAHHLTTAEGLFGTCPIGWSHNSFAGNCGLIQEGLELTKNIGLDGKKRFDLNAYHTLQSDGKVDTYMKMRTCTSYLSSSCGAYFEIYNGPISQTLTSSNQYFTCDTVGSIIYCPTSASVGWEGSNTFRPKTGTYDEHFYTIDSSATVSYKYGPASPEEQNDDICWWTSITNPGGSNPTLKSTYKFNTASQCHS